MRNLKLIRPKRIAPRLASGLSRERLYNALPPDVKAGLRAIADEENQSVSWTIEQVMLDYFKAALEKPEYVPRKTDAAAAARHVVPNDNPRRRQRHQRRRKAKR
jgi:hypothetical protein